MPDLDIVERHLFRPWRAPYRLLQGGHSPEFVAEAAIKAAAATLRDDHGIPGFEPLCQASVRARNEAEGVKTLGEVRRCWQVSLMALPVPISRRT